MTDTAQPAASTAQPARKGFCHGCDKEALLYLVDLAPQQDTFRFCKKCLREAAFALKQFFRLGE